MTSAFDAGGIDCAFGQFGRSTGAIHVLWETDSTVFAPENSACGSRPSNALDSAAQILISGLSRSPELLLPAIVFLAIADAHPSGSGGWVRWGWSGGEAFAS